LTPQRKTGTGNGVHGVWGILLATWLATAALAEPPSTAAVQRLIGELGHEKFAVRQAAQAQLLAIGEKNHQTVLDQCVRAYVGNRDPEVELRLHEVMTTLVEKHILRQPRGFLGIHFKPSTTRGAAGHPVPTFELSDVTAGGPAQKAGLQAGDHLLKVGMLEASQLGAVEGLANLIQSRKPGDKLKVLFKRGDATQALEIQLGQLPEELFAPSYSEEKKAQFFQDWLAGELGKLKTAEKH